MSALPAGYSRKEYQEGFVALAESKPEFVPTIFEAQPERRAYDWRKCPKLNWTMTGEGYVCDLKI